MPDTGPSRDPRQHPPALRVALTGAVSSGECISPGKIIDFYLYLAAALLTVRRLIQRARTLDRWGTRPTVRRLK